MKRLLALLAVVGLLAGCVSGSGPANNSQFAEVDGLDALSGEYRNLGEAGPNYRPTYLSSVIWPSSTDINHANVDVISVSVRSGKELVVRALAGNRLIKEGRFVSGEDFTIKGGKIYLKQKAHLSLAYPSGNPFIGPAYEETVIGLDSHGDGKLRHKGVLAGTAFLVIPVAGSYTDDIRFLRLDK